MPFMNLLLNLKSIHENKYLSFIYSLLNFNTDKQFVIAAGIIVGMLILISNGFAILNSTMKNRFVLVTTHNLSKRLLNHYLKISFCKKIPVNWSKVFYRIQMNFRIIF
jgi:hypothetical protein